MIPSSYPSGFYSSLLPKSLAQNPEGGNYLGPRYLFASVFKPQTGMLRSKAMDRNIYDLFQPELSPREMLELGVFGGWYFEGIHDEYPKDWFKNAKLSSSGFDVTKNRFGVASGLSRREWQDKGWITPEDPLGWFQWYCRFAMGRRLPEVDAFQIRRWKNYGPRHIGAIRKNCDPGDWSCRPRQRQGLLQWAYDPFV